MALASAYERMGQPAAAEQILRKGLEVHPDRFVLYSRLSRLKRNMGDRLGEIAVYREVLDGHASPLRQPAQPGRGAGGGQRCRRCDRGLHRDRRALSERREGAAPPGLPRVCGRKRHEQASALLLEDGLARLSREPRSWPSPSDRCGAAWGTSTAPCRRSARCRSRTAATSRRVPRSSRSTRSAGSTPTALRELNALRELSDNRALDFHAAGLYLRNGDFDSGYDILAAMLEGEPRGRRGALSARRALWHGEAHGSRGGNHAEGARDQPRQRPRAQLRRLFLGRARREPRRRPRR